MFSIVIGGEVLLCQLLLASAFRLAENRFGVWLSKHSFVCETLGISCSLAAQIDVGDLRLEKHGLGKGSRDFLLVLYCLCLCSSQVSAEQQCMLGWFETTAVTWTSCLWTRERCTLLLFKMESSQKGKVKQDKNHFTFLVGGLSCLLLVYSSSLSGV